MKLTAKTLSGGYGTKEIISAVTSEAKPSQLIALVGPNGSGKSTLIKTLAGLLPIQSGTLQLGDIPLEHLDIRERARSIAYLAQDRQAMPTMVVREILELGRAPFRGRLGQISDEGQAAIDRAIASARLEHYLERLFGELSGGEQARVLLGRALAVDAPILLADEPIAALDPYYQLLMMDILKVEAARGKAVIVALHDLALAHQFADLVWIMHQGRLAASGTPDKAMTGDIIGEVFKIALPFEGFQKRRLFDPK